MTDSRCEIRGCTQFLDERSGHYCTDHMIAEMMNRLVKLEKAKQDLVAEMENRIAELEKTKQVLEERIFRLNRMIARALDEDRL